MLFCKVMHFLKLFLLAWGVMCPKLQMLIYFDIKMSEKNQTFIFNVFWDIHVQTWVSVHKIMACKWLKGAFFRNIYLRKLKSHSNHYICSNFGPYSLHANDGAGFEVERLSWSCMESYLHTIYILHTVFSNLWGENIFHFLICVIFISETS